MAETEPTPRQDPAEVEEWFLSQLEKPDRDLSELTKALRGLAGGGETDRADACAELLQETITAPQQVVDLLELRASWQEQDAAFRETARRALADALDRDRLATACLKNVGFDAGTPLPECLRRLRLLLRLRPGTLCYDKTWGCGVVTDTDDFYQRVTIDFDNKSGHQMSLAYAAEVLQILEDDHILARRRRDPDALADLVRSAPDEVVKLALRSFGPLSVLQLQELLCPDIVDATGWKRFWDDARKGLKTDPLVRMPAKRQAPITLLETEESYDAAWFAALAAERLPHRIVGQVEELLEASGAAALEPRAVETLGRQLDYAMRACWAKKPKLAAQAFLAAAQLTLPAGLVDLASRTAALLAPETLLRFAHSLPARQQKLLLKRLVDADEEAALETFLAAMPQMHMTLLNEAMALLQERNRHARCSEVFRRELDSERPGVETLCWLAKRLELLESWQLDSRGEFAMKVFRCLEQDHHGEHLKARKQLAAVFEKKDWLAVTVGDMTAADQRLFMLRIKDTLAFPVAERQSLLGRIIKLFPQLHEALLEEPAQEEVPAAGRFTSWRSYRERQEQYQHLVNVEIPENSREIAVARSYGDLSENHEYKAAKEMQGILLRRQAELEESLAQIRGTDFSEFPKDKAGPGTAVTIQYADGSTKQYTILGEWDSDEQLGIISSSSGLARRLHGHTPNDTVSLPTAEGDQEGSILAVDPFPPQIEQWLAANGA